MFHHKSRKKLTFILILIFFLLVSIQNLYSMQVVAVPKKVTTQEQDTEGNTKEITKEGIFLFWIPQKKIAVDEFKISLNGKFLTTVRPQKDKKRIQEATKEQFEVYTSYFGIKDIDDLKNKLLSYDQQFIFTAIYQKELRDIMGISYEDYSKGVKKRKYTISSIKSGSVVETASSQYIEVGRYPIIPYPTKIKLEEGNEVVYITWEKNPEEEKSGVIGYKIYYSKEKDKNYQLVPEGMISSFKAQTQQPNKKTIEIKKSKARRRKKKEQPKNNKPTNPNEFSHTIKNLENNNRYYFHIKTVNLAEMDSEPSKTYTAIPRDKSLPEKVEIISVEQKPGLSVKAIIKWKPLKNKKNLNHYEVYRSSDGKKTYQKISSFPIPKNKTKYEDSYQFEIGVDYFYKVVGINKLGFAGIPSSEAPFTPKLNIENSRIDVLGIEKKTKALLIKWKPLKKNSRMSIINYVISRKSGIRGKYSTLTRIPDLNQHSFLDTNVKVGITYCYLVSTEKNNGKINEAGREKCNSPKIVVKLSPPTNVKSYTDQGGIVVTWEVHREYYIIGFLLYKKSEKEKKFSTVTDFPISGGNRRYIDKDIEEGVEYTYFLKTLGKGKLLSKNSPSTTAKKNIRSPDLPKNLIIYKKVLKKKKQYHIQWDYFDNADYFMIYMNKIDSTLGKTVTLGKTTKKEFLFNSPKEKGNYQVYIIAYRKGLKSRKSDRKTFSIK